MNYHNPFNKENCQMNDTNSRDPIVNDMLGNSYHVVREVYLKTGMLADLYNFLLQYGLTTNVAVKSPVEAVLTTQTELRGNKLIEWTSYSGEHSVLGTTGMRVLVLGQDDPKENGIYNVQALQWTRAVDFTGSMAALDGTLVFSIQGDAWQVKSPTYKVVVGETPVEFTAIDFFAREALSAATQKALEAAASAEEAKGFSESASDSEAAALEHKNEAGLSAVAAKDAEDNSKASELAAKESEDNAKVSEDNAKYSELSATNSASLAESKLANDATFQNTSAGIAGTQSGSYFRVPQGTGATLSFIYYRNDSGTATPVAELLGKGSISNNIRSYPTLALATADITNIPVGFATYIRSTGNSAILVEYVNNAGTLQPTGRFVPSSEYVETSVANLTSSIKGDLKLLSSSIGSTNALAVRARIRDLDNAVSNYKIPLDYVRQYGSEIVFSKTFTADTIFKLESLSLSGAARLSNFKIEDSSGIAALVTLLEGESIVGSVKKSNYVDFALNPTNFFDLAIDSVSGFTTVRVDAAIPGNLPADTTRIIRDKSGRFAAYTPSTIYGGTTEGVTYSQANSGILLKISNTAITDAGYSLDNSGVIGYIKGVLAGYAFSQQTSKTVDAPFCNLFRVLAGTVTVSSVGVTESDKTVMCVGTFYANKISSKTATASQLAINNLATSIKKKEVVANNDTLRNLALTKDGYVVNIGNVGTVGNPVNLSTNIISDARFVLDKFQLANVARRTALNITDGLGNAKSLVFLEGEYTNGSTKYTPYIDFAFEPREFFNIVSDLDTGFTSMDIAVVLPGGLPTDTTRIIRDRAGVWGAYTPVTIKSGKGITYNASTGRLTINVPNAEITNAGYDLTQKGVISYVVDNLSGYVFSQMTATITSTSFCNIFELAAGAVEISTVGDVESDKVVTMSGRLFTKHSGAGLNTLYKRLSCTVFNNLSVDTGIRPVYIKSKFAPGEVVSGDCLVVKDSSGNVYPAQWDAEQDFNPRRNARIGYWPDGSLRCGSIVIMDNIAANSSKQYTVEAHPAPQQLNVYSRTQRETQTSFLVTADDGTQVRFDSVVGWLPYKLTRDNKTYTSVCQHLLITRLSGSAATFSCGYADAQYRVLQDGVNFTEVETTFKNLVQTQYPTVDKQYVEMKYITKVFKNGYIKVDALHRITTQLPDNILYGSECRIQMDSTEAKLVKAGYNSIWSDNGVRRSISLLYANGDVRRDDGEVNTLAQRPSVINVNTTASYTRADVGWAQFSSSILGAPKDWAWTMGFAINMNEPVSDNVTLANIEHNPVTGFASPVSFYPRIRKATLMNKLAELITGIVAWSEHDASTVDTANGAFNTIAGSLVRHLYTGQGSFDAEYAKFDAWATTMYGGIGNIHMGSAAEYKGLQFASRLVLPHLNWFYQVALKKGDTAKVAALKVAIANMASDCHNAFGAIGKANSNFYAASYRAWGLAVMAGLDTNGTYAADMAMVDGQFSSSDYFEGATNIITDNPGENVGGMRYLHYQMYAYNNYLLGCKAANRTSVLDMKTYMLNAISAYGGLREIDYCVAESRRGNPTTVAFMLYPLLHSGDVSCLDAADRLMTAFDEYGGSNTQGQIKLWDLNYFSVIVTSFSEYTFACNILADAWMQWWLENNQS